MNPVQWLDDRGCAIFLFHGVVKRSDYAVRNYMQKHLLEDAFYGVIKSLARSGAALSMDDVVQHVSRREPFPARSFVVTFDDGLADVNVGLGDFVVGCGGAVVQ